MADIPYYLKRVNNRTASPIEASVGAYYYVFTKDLSTSVYRSASAIIELPDSGDVNVYGTDGYKRNAYISMGIRGYWTNNKGSFYGGLDLGMVCENNLVWHPAYYDATDRIGHGNDPDEASYTEFRVNPKFCVNAKLWCKIEQKYFKAGAAQAAAAFSTKITALRGDVVSVNSNSV